MCTAIAPGRGLQWYTENIKAAGGFDKYQEENSWLNVYFSAVK